MVTVHYSLHFFLYLSVLLSPPTLVSLYPIFFQICGSTLRDSQTCSLYTST